MGSTSKDAIAIKPDIWLLYIIFGGLNCKQRYESYGGKTAYTG